MTRARGRRVSRRSGSLRWHRSALLQNGTRPRCALPSPYTYGHTHLLPRRYPEEIGVSSWFDPNVDLNAGERWGTSLWRPQFLPPAPTKKHDDQRHAANISAGKRARLRHSPTRRELQRNGLYGSSKPVIRVRFPAGPPLILSRLARIYLCKLFALRASIPLMVPLRVSFRPRRGLLARIIHPSQ
jgi:hypothetical protein